VVKIDSLASDAKPLWKASLDTGELFSLAETYWLERHGGPTPTLVDTARGEVAITGKQGWKKYRGVLSDEKLRMVPFIEDILRIAHWGEPQAPRREVHQQQGMTIHPLRAAVAMDGRWYDVGLTVREDVNGKLFYDLGAIDFEKKGKSPDGPSAHPDITDAGRGGESTETRRSPESGRESNSAANQSAAENTIPHAAEAVNRAENYAASDGLTALIDGGYADPELREMFAQGLRALRDLSQDRFDGFKVLIEGAEHLSPEERQAAMSVLESVAAEKASAASPDGGRVNLDVRDVTPDWTPQPPERQAPPVTPETRSVMERALDAEAARLVQEGHATPEERALLERHKADMDALNREEEAVLSVLSCIMEAV